MEVGYIALTFARQDRLAANLVRLGANGRRVNARYVVHVLRGERGFLKRARWDTSKGLALGSASAGRFVFKIGMAARVRARPLRFLPLGNKAFRPDKRSLRSKGNKLGCCAAPEIEHHRRVFGIADQAAEMPPAINKDLIAPNRANRDILARPIFFLQDFHTVNHAALNVVALNRALTQHLDAGRGKEALSHVIVAHAIGWDISRLKEAPRHRRQVFFPHRLQVGPAGFRIRHRQLQQLGFLLFPAEPFGNADLLVV